MAHLLTGKQNAPPLYNDPDNYKTKYPPNAKGEELEENARIWRVYNDEAREFDRDMVQNWRETIDILLVFAGLFSAAVTTFVAQASLSLEPDYAKVSALLLAELVNERRGNGAGSNITLDSPTATASLLSEDFTPSKIDHWTCGLWFTSLALSLSTSLACVVVKQWLSSYLSTISATPRQVALRRQFRYLGLEAWRVPFIIGTLPQVLVLSLLLFLAGLVTFLFPRGQAIAIVIIVITALTSFLYTLSAIASAINAQCPYRTSLSSGLRYLWVSIIGRPIYRLFSTDILGWEKDLLSREIQVTRRREAKFAMESLYWLHNTAQAQVIIDLVIESLSALVDVPEMGFKSKLDPQDIWSKAFQHVCPRQMRNLQRPWLSAIRNHLYYWFKDRKPEDDVKHRLLRASRLVCVNCASVKLNWTTDMIARATPEEYWDEYLKKRRIELDEANMTNHLLRREMNVHFHTPDQIRVNSNANAAPQPPQEPGSNSNDPPPGTNSIPNEIPASPNTDPPRASTGEPAADTRRIQLDYLSARTGDIERGIPEHNAATDFA